jgi:hypothetical protein
VHGQQRNEDFLLAHYDELIPHLKLLEFDEDENITKPSIECILADREEDNEGKAAYLVKFKDRSHLHLEWKTEEWLVCYSEQAK